MKERVLNFGPGTPAMVGILSEPVDHSGAAKKPAILFANTGISHRVGPFRLNTELARRAAALGFFGLRFDFSGLGDNAARATGKDDYERAVEEAKAAMDAMEKRTGVAEFVWFGLCSSADKGHVIALADPRIVGAVFIDGYAHKTFWFYVLRVTTRFFQGKRLKVFVRARWQKLCGLLRKGPAPKSTYRAAIPSPKREKIENDLLQLAERGVEQLHLFTVSTDYVYNYEKQFWDLYPKLKGHARVQTERYPEADHTLSLRSLQLLFIDRVARWLERL